MPTPSLAERVAPSLAAAEEMPGGARPTAARGPRGPHLVTVFGIEVRLDWSVVIILALITFGLANGVLASWHPTWSALARWGVAAIAAVLFLGSILVHELSHALIGRMQGIGFRRITLFVFGGMAHMEGEPPTPRAELLMAIVGPFTSMALGAGALLAGLVLAAPAVVVMQVDMAAGFAMLSPVETLLLWLGPINLMLGVFNLVPGFPLDGGRVLRAGLWWWTGDALVATRWAASAGQAFALVLMGFGVFSLLGGGIVQGLWLLLIGWFLNNAARTSYDQMLLREALSGVTVGDVMRTRVESVSPDLSVAELVDERLLRSDQDRVPGDGADDELLGIVCLEDVRRTPRPAWASERVRAVMTPVERLETVAPETRALTALQRLGSLGVDQLPVVVGGRLRGLVRRLDVLRWLALHAERFAGAAA